MVMDEIHYNKNDFKIEWYSGTGAGGQHRNKHQNCCRITHIPTGLKTNGTGSRSRVDNQREAFEALAKLILAHHYAEENGRRDTSEVIRTYHAVRNEVHDKASGLKRKYKDVVDKGEISEMVDARAKAIRTDIY